MSSPASRTPSFTPPSIDPHWTVSELIACAPATLGTLHQAGIDACCGGGLSITEAARRHGVELEFLLEKLHEAATTIA